jgi:hypothetical protein
MHEEPTVNPNPLPRRVRDAGLKAAETVFGLLLAVALLYGMFYWVLYRGGLWFYRSAWPTLANDHTVRNNLPEGAKVLSGLLTASAGAVLATYVRRWFVLRSLRDKLRLIEVLRSDLLQTIGAAPASALQLERVTLGSDVVKNVLTDRDYGQLARNLAPRDLIDLLRTVAAIQSASAAVELAMQGSAELNIPAFVKTQLRGFNGAAVEKSLHLGAGLFSDNVEDIVMSGKDDLSESDGS